MSGEQEEVRASPQRLALITGGEGDLAKAMAAELGRQDYQVLAPGRSEMDVASTASVADYFSRLTRLDLLIVNAAITRDQTLGRMDSPVFDEVLNVNLNGAMRCCKAALKLMTKQRQGHIVTIGSFSALSGPVGQANYAAAKAALLGLTLSLAAEYGSRNIRINALLPGFLETRMTASLSEEVLTQAKARHVLGRFNSPECVARFLAFLDQEMPHTSGQLFNLDSRLHRWT